MSNAETLPMARAIVKYVCDALETDREKLATTVSAMMDSWAENDRSLCRQALILMDRNSGELAHFLATDYHVNDKTSLGRWMRSHYTPLKTCNAEMRAFYEQHKERL